MFNEQDPYVQFKLDFIRRALPARSAIVFGDMYMIDGGYTRKCVELGCEESVLIDTLETPAWQKSRIENPRLDFYKGDFSNPHFMQSINRRFDFGVAYEVLLHQAPLLNTLHLMLDKVDHRFCIVQPMLREQQLQNSLVYLPGNENRALYPVKSQDDEFRMFDVMQVNHSRWLWGMTVSFMRSVLRGEGFEIIYESEVPSQGLTDHWMIWGCLAERKERNPLHWSTLQPTPGLYEASW